MYVTTTNDLPGFRVTRHIGLVRGVTVRSRNAISDAIGAGHGRRFQALRQLARLQQLQLGQGQLLWQTAGGKGFRLKDALKRLTD